MKKLLSLLCLIVLASAPGITPCAGEAQAAPSSPALSLQDRLLMENTMLTLWDLHISRRSTTEEFVCWDSLLYLLRTEEDKVEYRSDKGTAAHFKNIPKEYEIFFPLKDVDRVSWTVFGCRLNAKAVKSSGLIYAGPQGYYLKPSAFFPHGPFDENADLPGRAEIQSITRGSNSSVIITGRLRKFETLDNGEAKLFARALFMACFSHTDAGWKLESFCIADEEAAE